VEVLILITRNANLWRHSRVRRCSSIVQALEVWACGQSLRVPHPLIAA
jgi:hypothetical protein